MTENKERVSGSGESLVFNTAEEARDFVERVEGKIKQDKRRGVKRKREVLAEELAGEIEKQGEESVDLSQPWEHSPEEHQEVQVLVETAFREDLVLALKKARKSQNYPRIIDLFHDVLTGQMYEAVMQAKINKQKVSKWQWGVAGLAIFLLVVALLVVVIV